MIPQTDVCADYFSVHLPRFFGKPLLPSAGRLSVCFEVFVHDLSGPPWRIVIEAGRLVSVALEGPEPACRFEVDRETALRIVSGEEPPQVAFFENRVDISGDIETGLVLSTMLEPFFRLYPFRPAAGVCQGSEATE